MSPWMCAGLRRGASQAGISLIETVVAATILAVAAGATATLLLGAGRTSVSNRNRTTASTLAERDQERLRGLSIDDLSALARASAASRSTSVGGVSFTTSSTVKWVSDGAGAPPSCISNGDSTSDYLQITSKVTPEVGQGAPSQTITSLVSPKVGDQTSRGTLAVPFADRDGNPVAGVAVTAAGPASGTATSNAAGCAVFAAYPSGDYTLTYNRSGYVTPSGDAGTQTLSGTVSTGQTNLADTQTYDRAAPVTVNVVTQPSASSTSTTGGSVAAARIANSGVDDTADGALTQTSTTRTSSFSFPNAFPFADGYAAYAGDCKANEPTQYGQPATRVTTNPATPAAVSVFAPTLTVNQPSALSTIRRLVVTPTDAGCSSKYTFTSTAGVSSVTIQLPFGKYGVCVNTALTRSSGSVTLTGRPPTTLTPSIDALLTQCT